LAICIFEILKSFTMQQNCNFASRNTESMDSKESLAAMFKYATEGILITDATGTITRVNPSIERLFGYAGGELLGKKVEVLIPSRFTHAHEGHRNKYMEYPNPRAMGRNMTLFARRKDGSEFPVEISLSYYEFEKETFVIAFIIDITERKKNEDALRQAKEDLEKQVHDRTLILQEAIHELENKKEEIRLALEKEKELNDMKSRFVSMASHEFRTPLSTILSSVSILSKYTASEQEEKKTKHINRIKSSVNNLTDILNDFLSIGKMEEGLVHSTPCQFNIRQQTEETVQELKPSTKEGQKIDYQHKGNEIVYLDKKLVKNIFINLVSNAIKFSHEGGLIELLTQVDEIEITISIKDYGFGIPEADQEHLFERFFRGHNVTNIQGTGLGLNIVAKYVELMNGTVEFESQENQGTTFTIKFQHNPPEQL
jgi:PAS domain S-box-containing protein